MTSEYITFSKYCTNKNLNKMIEYYYQHKDKIDLSKYNNYIFRYICEINNLKMLKWIYKLCNWKIKIDYSYNDSCDAFSYCCMNLQEYLSYH